jgi:hypothetical protein
LHLFNLEVVSLKFLLLITLAKIKVFFPAQIRLENDAPPSVNAPINLNIRDGSTALLTRSVITGRDFNGTYQNVLVNQSNALIVSDFDLEVSRGLFSDIKHIRKFGKSAIINAGQSGDVCNTSGTYAGFPDTTGETVTLVSTSNNDTSAGTGARTIEIFGLDENGLEVSESITLNGQTEVTSINIYTRLNRGIIRSAGSTGENLGVITAAHSTTTANVFLTLKKGQIKRN